MALTIGNPSEVTEDFQLDLDYSEYNFWTTVDLSSPTLFDDSPNSDENKYTDTEFWLPCCSSEQELKADFKDLLDLDFELQETHFGNTEEYLALQYATDSQDYWGNIQAIDVDSQCISVCQFDNYGSTCREVSGSDASGLARDLDTHLIKEELVNELSSDDSVETTFGGESRYLTSPSTVSSDRSYDPVVDTEDTLPTKDQKRNFFRDTKTNAPTWEKSKVHFETKEFESCGILPKRLPRVVCRNIQERESATDVDDDLASESKSKGVWKSKGIDLRFISKSFITLSPSTTQCLDVDLNYHGYTGKVRKVIIYNDITNFAVTKHDIAGRRAVMLNDLCEYYEKHEEEEIWGSRNDKIGLESGVLQRKIHIRDISDIADSVTCIRYEASTNFHETRPYEPQYFRFECDDQDNIVGESKCGMCAFCPEVKFYPYKNSSYLSHLTLMHGVFANNYIIPEGLYVGKYKLSRTSYSRKKNLIDGLQCPVCFEIITIKCWRTKSNPLLSYFRHFKKQHQKVCRSFIDSRVDPVNCKELC